MHINSWLAEITYPTQCFLKTEYIQRTAKRYAAFDKQHSLLCLRYKKFICTICTCHLTVRLSDYVVLQ